MGIIVEPPFAGSTIRVDSPDDIKIETELRKIASSVKNPARFVLVILPEVESRMYNRVKHAGDVKVGVHTVCVAGSKFAHDGQQVQRFANIGLKFNLKLGGINQLATSEGLGIISEDKTMVVGVDVTHPSSCSAPNAPSIAGMVASVDKRLGQWPADLRIQESRKEMVSELDSMLESRLNLWKSQGNHAAFPENLLVYRDGVSEGQYATVLEAELRCYARLATICIQFWTRRRASRTSPLSSSVSATTPVSILRLFPKTTRATAILHAAP